MLTPTPSLVALVALVPPAAWLFAATRSSAARREPFFAAQVAGVVALAASALVALALPVCGLHGQLVPLDPGGLLAVRLDAVTAGMLLLVNLLGFVIVRFSVRYLDGDPGRSRYARWLTATLAAVTLLASSDHLGVIAVCWMATSLSLHQLLTHFPGRPTAQLAAHKKFLVSRTADLCLLVAAGLVWSSSGTLSLTALQGVVADGLSPALHGAALLVAACAVLKSAQLPFHGWITQVMEAPTPVSALLHAGVVNLGGFVLIRLASLMSQAPVAQLLLVVVGATTAVIAGLVMPTRHSIKGRLAWSTMAQMGFMLLQCGLGAYALAYLHLLAHSFYKAHAFLSSGSTVERWQVHHLVPRADRPGLSAWAVAAVASLAAVIGIGALAGVSLHDEPTLWALGTVLALAVAPLTLAAGQGHAPVRTALASAGVAVLYFTWHAVFDTLVTAPEAHSTPWLGIGIVLVLFGAGYAAQALLSARPHSAAARAVRPALASGLDLDEWMTRLTFRIWPPHLPPRPELMPRLTALTPTESSDAVRAHR